MTEDLHDNARKCPHCGAWLGKIGMFRGVVEIIGWIFLVVFILGLASCGLMFIFK
jgi:hypothetical protein